MRGSPELLTGSCRLKMLESASPIAFADPRQPNEEHAEFQSGKDFFVALLFGFQPHKFKPLTLDSAANPQ